MRENVTAPEVAFEVLGTIDDQGGFFEKSPLTGRPNYAPGLKIWVRFFQVRSSGDQVGTDFCVAFDAVDFLIFMSNPRKYRGLIRQNTDMSPEEEAIQTQILSWPRGRLNMVPLPRWTE